MLQTEITVTVHTEAEYDYQYDARVSDCSYGLSYVENDATVSRVVSNITFATKEEMIATARAMLRACGEPR